MGETTLVRSVFFPVPPRDFPGRRAVRIVLRGIHVVTAGVLLGACTFDQPQAVIDDCVLATGATGLAFLMTDLHASFAVLVEVRGIVVLAKILALGAVWQLDQGRATLVAVTAFLAVVSSHMAGRYRHRVLVPGITADERKG